MRNKKSLNWALTISNIAQILLFVGFVILVILLGISIFLPSFGGTIEISQNGGSSTQIFLTDISIWMKIGFIVQIMIHFAVFWFILKEIIKILTSIQDSKTFYEGNVSSFKKLSHYGIILIIISAIKIGFISEVSNLSLSIPIGPIIFTIGCYLLADIFEEGKFLMEENKSIV